MVDDATRLRRELSGAGRTRVMKVLAVGSFVEDVVGCERGLMGKCSINGFLGSK